MAWLAVIVMCLSQRGATSFHAAPLFIRNKMISATKGRFCYRDKSCEFLQLAFIKSVPGVGGGFADGVDGEVLECAAVLHDVPSLGGLERAGWLEQDGLSRPLS